MNAKLHRLTILESHVVNLYSDGKYNEAIELANQLLENAKKSEDFKSMMKVYMNLISCYYYLGKIESAFENVLHYKLLCDEYGDDQDKYYLYSLSSIIYEVEENYEQAKEAIQECISLALELEMYAAASASYNNYSGYLLIDHNYEQALSTANMALQLAKKHCSGDILLQCQIYFNISAAYIGLRQFETARQILEPLESSYYINSNLHEKAQYLFTLATLYKGTNEFEKALYLLTEAYRILLEFSDQLMLKRTTKEMAEIYEILGNYKEAYATLKKYIKISEQLFKFRISSKIRELDIKHSVAAIEKRANIDSLSGVYNRYFLETTCNRWLRDVKQTGSHVCCIVIDADHFKDINDTYGHLVGDEVIKAVGKTCLEVFTEENTIVGRYGGDEFIVLLKGYSPDEVMKKAQILFQHITDLKVQVDHHTIQITISMGMVCTDSIPSAKSFTQLFRVADQALQMAKKQGKNQIVSLRNHCR